MNIIGDVTGKDAVLVDDMVDTAGTLAAGGRGAEGQGRAHGDGVRGAPHPLRAGHPAHHRTRCSSEVVFTDTVPLSPAAQACSKIRVLTTEKLFGEAIARISPGRLAQLAVRLEARAWLAGGLTPRPAAGMCHPTPPASF